MLSSLSLIIENILDRCCKNRMICISFTSVSEKHFKFAAHLDRNISITTQLIRLGPVWGPDSSRDCSSRCLLPSWRRGLFIIQLGVIFMNQSPNRSCFHFRVRRNGACVKHDSSLIHADRTGFLCIFEKT